MRRLDTAKYLFRKLREKLLLQLQQTRDLAALTEEAGPCELKEWLKLDIEDEAMTPLSYHNRPQKQKQSVYVLDEGKCKYGNVLIERYPA